MDRILDRAALKGHSPHFYKVSTCKGLKIYGNLDDRCAYQVGLF